MRICSGTLENEENLVELRQHDSVADTGDGGLSEWVPGVAQ